MQSSSTIARIRHTSMIGAAVLLAVVFMAGAVVMDFPTHVQGDYIIKLIQEEGRDKADIMVSRNKITGSTRGRDGSIETFSLNLNRPIKDDKRRQTRTGTGDIRSTESGRGSIVAEFTFVKKRRGFVKVFGDYDINWNRSGRERGTFKGKSDF